MMCVRAEWELERKEGKRIEGVRKPTMLVNLFLELGGILLCVFQRVCMCPTLLNASWLF